MFLPRFIASEAFLVACRDISCSTLLVCRIIRLSIGKQLEKYEQLGIKLERYSDKAILGKECLG
jgi:hypothetical protein